MSQLAIWPLGADTPGLNFGKSRSYVQLAGTGQMATPRTQLERAPKNSQLNREFWASSPAAPAVCRFAFLVSD